MDAIRILTALAVAACAAVANVAVAQGAFPTKPITIIVPFPPGGVTDPVARQVGARMAENVKQPVIVENKPGASGIIAAEFVKKQPGKAPNGETLSEPFYEVTYDFVLQKAAKAVKPAKAMATSITWSWKTIAPSVSRRTGSSAGCS